MDFQIIVLEETNFDMCVLTPCDNELGILNIDGGHSQYFSAVVAFLKRILLLFV